MKNVEATYQRLINKVFGSQIRKVMEVYIDDMVTKTSKNGNHCKDLQVIFMQVRMYSMHLNLEKHAFRVRGGKFLGFLLTSRGIEANPDKCRVIFEMKSSSTKKEVQ